MATPFVHNPAAQCECGDHFWRKMNRWGIALVSPEDADVLKSYHFTLFRVKRNYYCQSSRLRADHKTSVLHIYLRVGVLVDHANGNGLDNRRSNLRNATGSQNNTNSRKRLGTTSKFKGVSWRRDKKKWRAYLFVEGRQMPLGQFHEEEAAAKAYDYAARSAFGKFAKLNFPDPLFVPTTGRLISTAGGKLSLDEA